MKKLLAAILSVCMLVCLLSACGPTIVISSDVTSSDQTDDQQDNSQNEDEDQDKDEEKSSNKKSSNKKSSNKKSSNKNSSDKNSSTSKPEEDTADIKDFKGVWKLGKGKVDIIEINSGKKTVTAYDSNGYIISTFPVVETEEGIVLKMGAVGNVTLKEASSLSKASVPSVSKDPAYKGTYSFVGGDLPDGTGLEIKDDGKYEITGSKADHGPYKYKDMTVTLTPTIELLYDVDYKIVGGGKVLYAVADGGNKVRVFIKSDASGEAKAVANQCYIKSFDWKATDGSMTLSFNDKGRVVFDGEEMGVYYPTEKGITVEYSDGSTENLEIKDGKFSLSFFGKTFEK